MESRIVNPYSPAGQRVSKWLLFAIFLGFIQMVFAIAPFADTPVQAATASYTSWDGNLKYLVVPESVYSITLTLYGAGGGIGGKDCSSSLATPGYIGKITATLNVRPGDTITIAVGGGGVNGQSSVAALGSGSQAGTNPLATASGSNTLAYNGGSGGAAGGSGTSGSGGGGGAATVVHVAGHGSYVAAGAGGSGGDNCSGLQDAAVQAAVPSATSSRTRANNSASSGAALYGATGGSTSASLDGSGSGGGGGGAHGGATTDPAKYNSSSETYGYGGSGGTSSFAAIDSGSVNVVSIAPFSQVTSGCHYTGSTNWTNYGCGADGQVTIVYAPTPSLSQSDQNNASVQSTELGTVYIVNETVSVNSLADITAAPSNLKAQATISTINSPTNISLSGLSPGTYVAYAYSSSTSLLSSASRTTVAVGAMCTFTSVSGVTVSYSYRLGYCYATFISGSGTWTVPSGVSNVSVLAVGGGGGGGENGASGGGGGAIQDISYFSVPSGGSVSVTVGAGGVGGSGNGTVENQGSTGGTSTFGTISAAGGSGGLGGGNKAGGVGGSGGTSTGGTGGSGASSVGGTPTAAGDGATSLIFGISKYFAGGGAGGDWQFGWGVAGNAGGGTGGVELQQGASYTNAPANSGGNGFPNTGGGGGGGATNYGFGGTGGSGVIIIRYVASSYKPIINGSQTIYAGDTTTITSTSSAVFGGLTRTIRTQLSTDLGSTWSNLDPGTSGLISSYTTPSETNTTLTYWFRVTITDTNSSYTFTTASDTTTLTFLLRASNETDTALNFNGSQMMKTLPSTYSNSGGGGVEVWVKPATGSCATSYNQTVIYRPNAYWLYCQNGFWYGATTNGTNTGTALPYAKIPVRTNEWVHLTLAMSYNGAGMTFLNGQNLDWTGNAWNAGAAATSWYLGGSGNSTDYFIGQIDELKIWNSRIYDTQVVTDMDTYTVSGTSGLVAHYDFNEGSDSMVYNRNTPYVPGAMDFAPYLGSTSYTWSTIESSSISDAYKTTQFPRTIITAGGGWKIPKQVNSLLALLIGGGGGGGENAGGGGGGGGSLQGLAATRSTNTTLRIKVGMGGNPGAYSSAYSYSGIQTTAGTYGLPTSLATTSQSVLATAGGGLGGTAYSTTSLACSTGGTVSSAGYVSGGAASATSGFTNVTSNRGGQGGAVTYAFNIGQPGGSGFTYPTFKGSSIVGAGGGSGGWGSGISGGTGGGDSGQPSGGAGGDTTTALSGTAGIAGTGNGGGGAGGMSYCGPIGGQGGSGAIYLKYLNLDTVTVTGPNNDTATIGGKYTFRVTATNPNAVLNRTYLWQYSSDTGTTWSDITTGTGFTTNTYTTPTLDGTTGGGRYLYRCLVVDSDTSGISTFATSRSAYLTYLPSPTITGSATITTTYGTSATATYTPQDGQATRSFAMVPGTYGGILDPSFNLVGYETNTFSTGYSDGVAVISLSDSSTLVGGQAITSSLNSFAIRKLTPAGQLDNSFGTNGQITTIYAGKQSSINVLYVDTATGKIYAAGQVASGTIDTGKIGVARYFSNGILDTSFAIIGYETITVPNAHPTSGNYVTTIALQSDGKILLGANQMNASSLTDTATVIRLTSSGAIDNTFGSSGFFYLPWGAGYNYIKDLKFASDGSIWIAGRWQDTNSSGRIQFAYSHLTSTGALDISFGSQGTLAVAVPCASTCSGVMTAKIASDNSAYFAFSNAFSPTYLYTARFLSYGYQDSSWGTNGFTTDQIPSNCFYMSMNITSSGEKVVLCGFTIATANWFSLTNFGTSGVKVNYFGINGIASNQITGGYSGFARINGANEGIPVNQSLAIDQSNNFIIAGTLQNGMSTVRLLGSTIATAVQSQSITLDTGTFEVAKISIDTYTSAGTYIQSLIITDTMSATTAKAITITVNKAPAVTITASSPASGFLYTGDSITLTETSSVTGLVAGDTLTLSYRFKAPSTDTLTANPISPDTYTITPLVTSINHGTITNGSLNNYLATNYVPGSLTIFRGVRSNFALNSGSGFAYGVVGAPLQLVPMFTMDTSTVNYTLVSGSNCTLDPIAGILNDTATTSTSCVVTATIARSLLWETATATTTFTFQSYVNYYPSPTAGTGPNISLPGQPGWKVETSTGLAITSISIYSYDTITTGNVVLTVIGSGFGTDPSALIIKIGRKLPVALPTNLSNTTFRITFSITAYGNGTNWGKLSVSTASDSAIADKDFIAGPTWSYSG